MSGCCQQVYENGVHAIGCPNYVRPAEKEVILDHEPDQAEINSIMRKMAEESGMYLAEPGAAARVRREERRRKQIKAMLMGNKGIPASKIKKTKRKARQKAQRRNR